MAKFKVNFGGHRPKTAYLKKEYAFVSAVTANSNAESCVIKRLEIDFQPIATVFMACKEIFEVVDRDDEFQGDIARVAWRLKTTLNLTALPFDDERLNLDALVGTLESAVSSVPEISNSVKVLRRTIDNLIKVASNPKRDWLLNVMQMAEVTSDPIAMLVNLHGVATPGWPNDIGEGNEFSSRFLTLVRTRKDIADSFYTNVVVPGNPRFAPHKILFDLLYGGRSSQVCILSYRAEHSWIPALAKLPEDRLFFSMVPVTAVEKDVEVVDAIDTNKVDTWANDSFWDSIRHQHAESIPTSDRDIRVRARFVLFADGSGSFLPEDGRVVEISTMLDLGQELDTTEDRLPRKAAIDLEEGDLIMMRLSGSGDYLDDVADELMTQAGEENLRTRAFDWKDWLNRVLKQQGEGVLARKLRDLNVSVRSPQYLWAWSGDAVMAPHDLSTFTSLIHGLNDLDSMTSGFNVEEYARAKWGDMEAVKVFHQKAGSAIRSALVSRVKDLIKNRQRVDTVQVVELQGVKSGKMGLMRVSALDTKSIQIPMSKLFQLEKIVVH